ncbi:hypothetical protein ARMSODRAFT_1083602 [Armillaria solidipes]|uniref:Poly(A) RNA polymerase mitochondrial-like central palm domain-containing protein n=1 Tax=Armillaria solidipes TaxID=1076256 RepID=A0A2H3BKS0_9AGAR|nr:hypothetical protein ARMSODRAFT_1083602 [Armillaria solidipes]
MRSIRFLSTRQPLWELPKPHVTQSTKKLLRKVEMRVAPQVVGPQTKQHLQHFLQSYISGNDELVKREDKRRKLQDVLASEFGKEILVEDISMASYGRDIRNTPMEFAIVDTAYPAEAIPLRTMQSHVPSRIHNHKRVVEVLLEAGFRCKVPERDLDLGGKDDFNLWASSEPTQGPVYPPRLRVEDAEDSDSLDSFHITFAGPTVVPLHKWLAGYLPKQYKDFMALFLIYLWSQGIEFPTTALALMTARYRQARDDVPPLFRKNTSIRWVPANFYNPIDQVWESKWEGVRLPGNSNAPHEAVNWKALHFLEMLQFWRQSDVSPSSMVSVREGGKSAFIPRPGYALSPDNPTLLWHFNPLVVQDPIIPTHNHACTVSKSEIKRFAYACKRGANTLSQGNTVEDFFFQRTAMDPSKESEYDRRMQDPDNEDWLSSLNEEETEESDRLFSNDGSFDAQPQGAASLRSGYAPRSPHPPRRPYGIRSYSTQPTPPGGVTPTILRQRKATVTRVQNIIQKEFGDIYSVEQFGSTRYGISSANSDLDLVLIDPKRPHGVSPKQGKPHGGVYNIKRIGSLLRKKSYQSVSVIDSASVPIVKFRDPITDMDCDLNINDRLGLHNSDMVKRYCDLSPLLRPMVRVIKKWAKPLKLNSPSIRSGGRVTFSSYALTLITIAFLQTHHLLPNLQEGVTPLSEENQDGLFWFKGKPCNTKFNMAEGWVPPEQKTVNEAMLAWFRYWGFEHDYTVNTLISIRAGGIIEGPEFSWDDNEKFKSMSEAEWRQACLTSKADIRNYRLLVADPFVITKNVTGNIQPVSFSVFRAECQLAFKKLLLPKTPRVKKEKPAVTSASDNAFESDVESEPIRDEDEPDIRSLTDPIMPPPKSKGPTRPVDFVLEETLVKRIIPLPNDPFLKRFAFLETNSNIVAAQGRKTSEFEEYHRLEEIERSPQT